MTPKVAIRCITYNHEPYIRDALEGFVMQKTSFPFVAVVHDDASTDGTADIIREYAEKYPDIIKPLYETENQYSKGDGSMSRMMNQAVLDTGAKYVALCEGDDYWTDPLKLQKQVDFLETHPDYSMAFANVKYLYENGNTDIPLNLETREYEPIELYEKYISPTPTVMFRAHVIHSDIYQKFNQIKRPVFGDITLFMACGVEGKIYGMADIIGMYRRLSSGAAASILTKHSYRRLKNSLAIAKILGSSYLEVDKRNYVNNQLIILMKHPFQNYPENLQALFRLFWLAPWLSIKKIGSLPYRAFRKFKGKMRTHP